MAAVQPVRMPSSEWASKDKSAYDRNPFRNHHSPSPSPKPPPAAQSPGMLQSAKAYLFSGGGGSTAITDSPLPSKEIPSGSRGGVGSLPGNYSEVSVAKTPEERRLENMPSHETDQELLGKTNGVGPLPGGPNESRVAMLPEERIHPQYDSGTTGTKGFGAAAAELGVGAGSAAVASRNVTPRGGSSKLAPAPATGSGIGSSSATEQAQSKLGEPDIPRETSEGPTGTSERRSTSGSEDSTGERHKVGFMKKVKGEAKVISGKLGRNEKKVEEGRQMMGK
ncbi:hypothetical protein C0991_005254 [Blastosporella zonata]|nr:hypothetical protein C0991_005254 [Blastosporella zonata]